MTRSTPESVKNGHIELLPRGLVLQDSIFLIIILLISFAFYIKGLGFYSDDWDYLSAMSNSHDQSFIGLYKSIYIPNQYYRPVQILYWASLYWLFGANPMACHLINSAVLTLTVLIFYLTLLKLRVPRYLSLVIPLVFGLLPHYSTVRFWFSAYENILSVGLYLFSLYSDLRALRSSRARWLWKSISILSMWASLLSYEVPLPLFLLNVPVVWFYGKFVEKLRKNSSSLQWINVFALAVVVLFKAMTPVRTGTNFLIHAAFIVKQFLKPNYGPYEYGFNPIRAVQINVGYYGLGLPYILMRIIRDYPNRLAFAISGLGGAAIFGYLYRVLKESKTKLPGTRTWLIVIASGMFIFALGYAIFLTNSNVQFSLAGIANRTAVAAALGLAGCFVGALGWCSNLASSDQGRRKLFGLLVALLCSGGILINNTIASFWISAYEKEMAVLADIRRQFPSPSHGTTILLDGICPYDGPAIVFESRWDLAGALKMAYHDPSIKADIITPKLSIEKDFLSTTLYVRIFYTRYAYGPNLWIYDFGRKEAYRITDIQTARQYFRKHNRDFSSGCPEEHEGHGFPIF